MKKTTLAMAIFAGFALGSNTVSADINLSGFGQIVGGTVSGDADELYGYDSDLSFTPESLFGLQINASVSDRLTATAQLVGRGDQDFDPDFAWAYLTYRFNDQWDVRAGRIRIPFYKYSDFLDVGYAYHWTRTPSPVYQTITFSELDGVNFSHSAFIGDWFSRFQLLFGRFEGEVSIGGEMSPTDLSNVVGGAWELSYEWFNARLAYFQTDTTIDVAAVNPLLDTLRSAGFPDVASDIAFDGDTGSFWGVALEGDWGDYFVSAEVVNRKVRNSLLNDVDGWYIGGGTRLDDWTFHGTVGRWDASAQLGALDGLPADHPLFPVVSDLLASQASKYDYISLGARWDFARNTAMKFEYERRDYDFGGEDANVFSAGVVFTF